ncbi:MAG: sulfite exporter TauE/SafE family protein [Burkholderiales bacterium]|nr:sulfite exporter TauE/SafE family protein [Burkholderiales bacterium]
MQMPVEVTIVSALLVGLLGSTHCLAMCGGIAGSLSLSGPGPQRAWRSWLYLLAYNGGRISSYAIAGALLGWISRQTFDAMPAPAARHAAQWISAGFMIALGLYLSGWWRGLALLERAGAGLWRHIAPFGRRLLPIRHPLQAWMFGMVWGWLPCGLVYSALAWSLSAGSPATGALLMAAFGAGTLPMMLASGAAARALGTAVRSSRVRRASGLVVLALGVIALLMPGGHDAHRHHGAGAMPMAAKDG